MTESGERGCNLGTRFQDELLKDVGPEDLA